MSARRAAHEVVRRTFEEGAYADRIFPAEADRAHLDERDRRLAMRLAYGTVQRVRTLDHAMETLASRPPGALQPTLRAALRVGAYQLLFASGSSGSPWAGTPRSSGAERSVFTRTDSSGGSFWAAMRASASAAPSIASHSSATQSG